MAELHFQPQTLSWFDRDATLPSFTSKAISAFTSASCVRQEDTLSISDHLPVMGRFLLPLD